MTKGTKRTLIIALTALVIFSQLLAGCSGMIQLVGDGNIGLDLGLNPDEGEDNTGEHQSFDTSPLLLWMLTGILLAVAAFSAIALAMSQAGRNRPR